jgi:hypothetical protein
MWADVETQGVGTGRLLLDEIARQVRAAKVRALRITVINLREELTAGMSDAASSEPARPNRSPMATRVAASASPHLLCQLLRPRPSDGSLPNSAR